MSGAKRSHQARGFVRDAHTAFGQQFLNVAVGQREAVVEMDRVLDDGRWESVALGFVWVAGENHAVRLTESQTT